MVEIMKIITITKPRINKMVGALLEKNKLTREEMEAISSS